MKDIAKAVAYAGLFAVPFIVLIISNDLFFPYITGKNFTFRIIVEVVFAAWVILALYEPRYRPNFSWISTSFLALLVIMFVANWTGEFPLKSFWSNFERMEGFVTLVHVFLYFTALSSLLTTDKLWTRYLNTTLIAASCVALYAFQQLAGGIDIKQGGWRLDGTLGNSAYMAIYTLFHIFIALYLLLKTQSQNLRYVYAAFTALFVFLLIQTATRGTTLGLVGGSFVTVLYVVLFAKDHPRVRKIGAGVLCALVILVGLFVSFKDSSFIQENRYLQRIANISLETASTRFEIWSMALEGVKERPLLGWGQGNFNYVFNKYYEPSLYAQESWFDRVHNIVVDWLIAGGVLGAIAYFGLFAAALYYLFWLPLVRKDESFSVVERGVLIGLLAGYLFHNLFVFDNIVSYIFFAMVLALIHARVARPMRMFENAHVDKKLVEQIAIPVILVLLCVGVYKVNVPNILAAKDIINAYRTTDPAVVLDTFEQALARNSFADQEIREQLTHQAQNIARSNQYPAALRERAFNLAERELLKQIEEKPGDARIHVFISSFYRVNNQLDLAEEQLEIARALSPNKQQIIFEQGMTQLQKQEYEKATAFFKEAYDLAPSYTTAAVYYATAALYAGDMEQVNELLSDDAVRQNFALNDLSIQAAYATKQFEMLKEMFEVRIERNPLDPQMRTNLAVVYDESGDTEGAIRILEEAGEAIPSFKAQADSFIEDLRAGRRPGEQPPAATLENEVE